tara:strand:- start:93252 stop:93488 length:237 start_codon:yes stop_codon:yes gene_type:complete
MKDRIVEIANIRAEIRKCEEELDSLTEKLTKRKEELSKDELFNSLNNEYMELQKKNHELLTSFTMKMDELITDEGENV